MVCVPSAHTGANTSVLCCVAGRVGWAGAWVEAGCFARLSEGTRGDRLHKWVGSEALMLGFARGFGCVFEEEGRKWTSVCLAMLGLRAEAEGENPTF